MKFAWIFALMMAVSSFALETYECKDIYGFANKISYYIVKIGTREQVSYTEYDDKKICERDAAKLEAKEKERAAKKEDEDHGWANSTNKGWRESDGTLLWEKRFDGGYYCYDKTGMKVTKRVKEAKYCK